MRKKNIKNNSGYTLLFAIILSSILLSVGVFIANTTTKEVILSGVVKESAVSYAAAQSGMECALYYHYRGGKFNDTQSVGVLVDKCSDVKTKFTLDSGNTFFTHSFNVYFYSDPGRTIEANMCAKVVVRKYFENAQAVGIDQPIRTLIESKGYNVDCTRANATGGNSVLKLERAIYFEDSRE